MKQFTIILFCVLFGLTSVYSQEEKGEGDLFLEQNPDYSYTSNVSGTESNPSYTNTANSYSERVVVDHLFTLLPFDEIKAIAKAEKKSYYIDFTADWCAPCKMMDKTTFRDYNVVEYTKENFYAVQLDMSDFDAIEMQAMYNISSLPTILFFDYEGNLLGRTTGLQTGTLFLQKLQEINTYF